MSPEADTAPYEIVDPIGEDLREVQRVLERSEIVTAIGLILVVAWIVLGALTIRELWPPRSAVDPNGQTGPR